MNKKTFKISQLNQISSSLLNNKVVLNDVIVHLDLSEKNIVNLEKL